MAHKKMGQASFVEAFLRPDVGVNRRLERDRADDRLGTAGQACAIGRLRPAVVSAAGDAQGPASVAINLRRADRLLAG